MCILKDHKWKDFSKVAFQDSGIFDNCKMKRCSSFYEGKIYVCSRAAIMTKSNYILDDKISIYLPKKQFRKQLKRLYLGYYSNACYYCDGDSKYAKDVSAGEQE